MSNPWFRMYSEFAHDPKVQMMPEDMQRRYIMIMCMRCSNALVTLHETEIAFHLRISDEELARTKALFISKGFIDEDWNLLNWEKRQFSSDSSAARVAKHRANKKNGGNADVTLQKRQSNALDTDTDTDTDKTAMSDKSDPAPLSKAKEVLEYLNLKTNRSYRPVPANLDLIRARIGDGVTPEQCRSVIDLKTGQWADDDKMRDYLRPGTLFNRTKFEQYLGQLGGTGGHDYSSAEDHFGVAV